MAASSKILTIGGGSVIAKAEIPGDMALFAEGYAPELLHDCDGGTGR